MVRRYLVSADLAMFDKKAGTWGFPVNPPLRFIANYSGFLERVKQWEDIKRSIAALGAEICLSKFEHNDYY